MHSAAVFQFLSIFSAISSVQASSVWTVNCGVLTIQRSDPILSVGVASSHVHSVVGGTAFSRNMSSVDAAVNANATTCDKYTDHSNYVLFNDCLQSQFVADLIQWCPQLYHMTNGMFELVQFTGANMYYENQTCDYDATLPHGYCDSSKPRQARAFPPGFRMIAGNSARRTQNNSDQTNQAIQFTNGNQKNVYGIPQGTLDGNNLQGAVQFPSCYDGRVDSPDHKSHVAYPDPSLGNSNTQGGMCPSSHPYALINIGAEFGFALAGITDPTSLVFANGDTTGFGFHGDFLQGWTDSAALQNSFADCFTNDDCPWRAFGTPDGKDGFKESLNPQTPAVYEEEIGLNGPISKLPGNNPVYSAGLVTVSSSVAVSSVVSSAASVPKVVSTTSSAALMAGTCPPGCVPAQL